MSVKYYITANDNFFVKVEQIERGLFETDEIMGGSGIIPDTIGYTEISKADYDNMVSAYKYKDEYEVIEEIEKTYSKYRIKS